MEIRELIERFFTWREVNGYAVLTNKMAGFRLKLFEDYLLERGMNNLEALNREMINDFQEELAFRTNKEGRFLEPSYRNQVLGTLRCFFKWLKNQDLLAHDLGESILWIREPAKLPKNILTPEEMNKLLKMPDITTHKGYRDRLLMELLYGTGIRSRELLNIKVMNVDMDQAYLHVCCGKGAKDRVVPLSKGLCELLAHYLSFIRSFFLRNQKSEYLFPGVRHETLSNNWLAYILKFYGKKAGIEKRIHPHAFRHACATHMMQNGAPIRYVQELLGHTNINTTQIYTHVTITDLKKAHAKYHPRERMLREKTIEKKGAIPSHAACEATVTPVAGS